MAETKPLPEMKLKKGAKTRRHNPNKRLSKKEFVAPALGEAILDNDVNAFKEILLGPFTGCFGLSRMSQIDDTKLKQATEVLKSEFRPSRLFLFGSRAKGTQRADSDYDFVVVSKKAEEERFSTKAHSLIREKCGVSADVFIYSESEFDEWKDELSSIAETAVNTGLEIDLG